MLFRSVPVRLGDEFQAYAQIISDHISRIRLAANDLKSLGLGGSASGTGLNTHPKYCDRVAEKLGEITGFDLKPAQNLMAAMQSMAPFVNVSGSIRNLAQDTCKIANDLRLMDSGPKTGLREITRP